MMRYCKKKQRNIDEVQEVELDVKYGIDASRASTHLFVGSVSMYVCSSMYNICVCMLRTLNSPFPTSDLASS